MLHLKHPPKYPLLWLVMLITAVLIRAWTQYTKPSTVGVQWFYLSTFIVYIKYINVSLNKAYKQIVISKLAICVCVCVCYLSAAKIFLISTIWPTYQHNIINVLTVVPTVAFWGRQQPNNST